MRLWAECLNRHGFETLVQDQEGNYSRIEGMSTPTSEATGRKEDQPNASKPRPRVAFILSTLLAAVLMALILGTNILPEWPQRKPKPTLTLNNPLPETTAEPVITVKGHFSAPGQIILYLGDELIGTTSTLEEDDFAFQEVPLVPGINHLRLVATPFDVHAYSDSNASIDGAVEWIPDESAIPKFIRVPTITDTAQLIVRGVARPGNDVTFYLLSRRPVGRVEDEASLGEAYRNYERVGEPIVVSADDKGVFQSEVRFPQPGTYKLLPDFPGSELTSTYNFSRLPSITYDPFRSCNATLLFGYTQTKTSLEITLSRDNPEAIKLITGQTSLAKFIHKVLGLSIGPSPVAYDFWDVVPHISSNEKTVTVSATATSNRGRELPVLNGTISINKQSMDYPYRGFPSEGPKDNIKVRVTDFSVDSYFPPPTTINDGYATWSRTRDRFDYAPNIQVRLSYDPLSSPANFFRLLSLSPYALFGSEFSKLFQLFYGFLYTVPILWTLWLLHNYNEGDWIEPAYARQLHSVCRALVAIIYVSPLSRLRTIESLYLVVAIAVVIVIIGLSIWLIGKSRRKALRFWIWESLLGMGYAFAFNFLLDMALSRLGSDGSASLLPATLVAFTILLFVIICLRTLVASSPLASATRAGKFYLLVGLVSLVLAYPQNVSIYSLWDTEFPLYEITRSNVHYFFSLIQDLMPYVLLAGIISVLKLRRVAEVHNNSILMGFGWIIFVAYVVGATPNWFIIPIPLLLALKLYPMLVIQPAENRYGVNLVKNRIYEERSSLLHRALSIDFAQNFRSSLEQLHKKINSGDLTPTEFEKRKSEIEDYAARLEQEQALPYGLKTKNVILNFGPYETDWENGVHAVRRGLIIALPFLIVYLWTFLLEQRRSGQAYLLLWLTIRLVDFLSGWVVSAFFFGYFFSYIRGDSGLKKGLNVAATVIICLTPVWFLSGSSTVELAASFLRAGQIFLFFTILGIWAFDYRIFRDSLQEKFSWKTFTQFGDMPSLTAVASVLITSVGVAVSSVLSGQFTTVVSQLVSVLFPQLPALPTK